MTIEPDAPAGYDNGYILDPELPGETIVIFVVFLVTAWGLQLRRTAPVSDPVVFILGAIAVVAIVEVLHEIIHVSVFRVHGIRASVHWTVLSVIPDRVFVPRRTLNLAAVSPFFVLTPLLGVLYALQGSVLAVNLCGLAIAVNVAVSVLDAL